MFQKIKDFLKENSINFKEIHHEPTKTSEDSAKARGEDIKIGGKALVLKIDGNFKILVLSAAKKLDSNLVKKFFNAKKVRFADQEELMNLTGLVPGSVPPFGSPIIKLELYVDNSIIENEKIAFNAGSLTDSIVMSTKDYIKISNPIIFTFSQN